jgi:hypothetical protein
MAQDCSLLAIWPPKEGEPASAKAISPKRRDFKTLAVDLIDWKPATSSRPSPATRRKATSKHTDPAQGEPIPVHSFHTLLADLATLTRNAVRLGRDRITAILATPTKIQRRAFQLLGVAIAA